MALTQRSLTLVFLATFAMAATTPPTPLTPPTPSSCPESLFGLHITASRNSTGYDNVKARLDQPEGATWQMDLAAAEHAAPGGGGERRRVTTIALFAEAGVIEDEGEDKGMRRRLREQEATIADLQASNAKLQQRLDSVEATLRANIPLHEATVQCHQQAPATAPTATTAVSGPSPTALFPSGLHSTHTNKTLAEVSEQLAHAAYHNNLQLMKDLVAKGVNLLHRECYSHPTLHWAAHNGIVDGIRLMLEIGTPVDIFDNERRTALHWAVKNGKTESVKVLVNAGANLDLQDNNGWTVLHYAAIHSKPELARVLMDAGADPRIRDNQDKTPQDHTSNAAILAPLTCSLGPRRTAIGLTPRRIAATPAPSTSPMSLHSRHTNKTLAEVSEQLAHAAYNNNLQLMKQLVAKGVNLLHRECYSHPTLHWAAHNGIVDGVRLMLEIGTPVDIFDNERRTALHWAVKNGQTRCVEVLVAAGSNLDLQDNNGRTVLHYAAIHNKLDVTRILLDAGADHNVRDNQDKTAHDHSSNSAILVLLSCK